MSNYLYEKLVSLARIFRFPIVLTVNVETFGNTAEEIYLGLLRARSLGRKIIFVFVWDVFGPFVFSKKGLGVNRTLKRIESPYLAFSQDSLFMIILTGAVTGSYCFLKLLWLIVERCPGVGNVDPRGSSLLVRACRICVRPPNLGQQKLWTVDSTNTDDYSQIRAHWVNKFEEPLEVLLNKKDEEVGRDLASALGLAADRQYVCLHVRETGFYGPVERKGKTIRNGSIATFIPAIKYLVENNYTVVRLGDPTMTPLPNLSGLIDYPFSKEKSHLMDVWLIKHCEFFFGHNSGPNDVAYLFQKPALIPNITLFLLGNPVHAGSLCLLKHVFSKKKQRYLSVEELVELYLSNETSPLRDSDLLFVENTADDLLDLVREYLETKSQKSDIPVVSDLQRAVLERRWDVNKSFLHDPTIAEPSIFKLTTRNARYLSRLLGCSGLIANNYLEKNYIADSLNHS